MHAHTPLSLSLTHTHKHTRIRCSIFRDMSDNFSIRTQLHAEGISLDTIRASLGTIQVEQTLKNAMVNAHKHGVDLRILSDANTCVTKYLIYIYQYIRK
jgi:hypothetical protein